MGIYMFTQRTRCMFGFNSRRHGKTCHRFVVWCENYKALAYTFINQRKFTCSLDRAPSGVLHSQCSWKQSSCGVCRHLMMYDIKTIRQEQIKIRLHTWAVRASLCFSTSLSRRFSYSSAQSLSFISSCWKNNGKKEEKTELGLNLRKRILLPPHE